MSLAESSRFLGTKGRHYLKSLRRYISNRRWFTMYILGRFQSVRWLATLLAHPKRVYTGPTLFPDIKVNEVVNRLRVDGYCTGLQLPKETVNEIMDFADTHLCFDDQFPNDWFGYPNHRQAEANAARNILIGRYANSATECPAIAALQSDSVLLQIAADYFGRHPIHIGNRLWWSFATKVNEPHSRVRSGQAFHYDLDDYQTATFFFYLTDVDKLGGPHTVVRTSHIKKRLRYILSIFKTRDEAELLKYYGTESFVELSGQAGSGFVEDLLCYHRGTPPIEKDRLILQIRFALNDYGTTNDNDTRSNLPVELQRIDLHN